MVETVKQGTDVTVVSYGSTFNLCQVAAEQLENQGISVELIDVQTLMPFDINHDIAASLKKTNRIIFIDEDFPGGTTAYHDAASVAQARWVSSFRLCANCLGRKRT